MRRLTTRNSVGMALANCEECPKNPNAECHLYYCRNKMKDRLADYEDTGLEPEEIRQLIANRKNGINASGN